MAARLVSCLVSCLVPGVRFLAALMTVVLLAGCGAFDEPDGPAISSHTARTRYAAKGDDKPHPGVARALRHPVQGIDVSRYQGRIDWKAVRAAGTRFAFIKATEGGDHLDPNFMLNWTGAKAAGVPRAAYHFVWWCRPAAEQAAWFIRNVPRDASALPPVIDAEWAHGPNCSRRVSREDGIAKIRIISDMLYRHYGRMPILYTDINFHKDVLVGVNLPNPFWLRSTAAEPHVRYASRRWTLWQFTQTGRVPGIKGHVDRNAFYGTDREFETFMASGCDPRDHGRLAHCTGGNPGIAESLVASIAGAPDPEPVVAPPPPPVQVAVAAAVPIRPTPVPTTTIPVAFVEQPAPILPAPARARPKPVLAATMVAPAGGEPDLGALIDQLLPPDQQAMADVSDE